MVQSFHTTVKRFHVVRFLLIIVIAFVIFLVGSMLVNYLPVSWYQQIGINPASISFFNPQPLPTQLTPSPVATLNTMPGMNSTSMPGNTPTVTMPAVSPTMTGTQGTGLITVITMTPTTNLPTAVLASSQSPTPALPIRTSVTPNVGTTTPIPPSPIPPTITLTPAKIIPTLAQDQPAMLNEIKTELHDLNQVLQASLAMLETFRQRQPTEIELIALKAELGVADQRMGKLVDLFQGVLSKSDPLVKDSRIFYEVSHQLLELMQLSTGMIQPVLANPALDQAAVDRIQRLIGEFQKIVEQIPGWLSSVSANNQPIRLSATPTMSSSPTATSTSTANPTEVPGLNDELRKLQSILEQMKEMLSQIQGMLK